MSIAAPARPGRGARLQALAWPYRWPLLASLYLCSPVWLYELGLTSQRGGDKIALFALPASLLWLLLLQLVVRRQVVAHLLLAPFYFIVAVDLFLVFLYDTRLTSSTMTVFVESLSDTGRYLSSQAAPVALGVALLLFGYGLCLFQVRRVVVPRAPRVTVLVGLAIFLLYGLTGLRQIRAGGGDVGAGLLDVLSHDRSSPFGIFPQAYFTYHLYEDSRLHREKARTFRFGARQVDVTAGPEIVVLVVGESSRPDHWGVYGYGRDTTPRLAREENMVVFRDVLSQAALTQISVPLLLTRGRVEALEASVGERSILSAYREVGFRTYWLSTQQRDQWTGAVNRYPAEADTQRFFDRRPDAVLVDAVQAALAEQEGQPQKLFFVLHTQGSHFTYADRYPAEGAVFPTATAGLSEQQVLINSYDNTIRATDELLASLIALLRQQPGTTSLLYVADHGENLQDDDRGLSGHFLNNEFDLPIPMVLWGSDAFWRRAPARAAAARANAGRRLNTRAVFYTLLDMAGIVVDDPHQATLSALSPGLVEVPRLVLRQWKPVDYDRWRSAP